MHATEEKRAEKYISQGIDEEETKEKAHEKTLWLVKRIFFDYYLTFLSLNFHLKDDDTHQELIGRTWRENGRRHGHRQSIERIMGRYRPKFDNLFDYGEPDEVE